MKENMITKSSENTSTEEKRNKEKELLLSWHPSIKNAMKNLHQKFKSDTKFILTESDLKCWIFYFLQQEKPYILYAVHTEVTHYALHTEDNEEPKKKYKLRDLSLLCPWKIKENEEIWKNEGPDDSLSKGFKHRGPAIHFELKFARQMKAANQIKGLEADIEKIGNYYLDNDSPIRHFIIVCGSRCEQTKVEAFEKIVRNNSETITDLRVKKRVWFYLFDADTIVEMHNDGNGWQTLNF